MTKFIHVIEYVHEKLVFHNVFHIGVYSAFCTDVILWLECGLHTWFNKIGCMVNNLVSVIHSYPNPTFNKLMTHNSTYLRENNYISIYLKMLRGTFHDRYDHRVDCEWFHGFVKSKVLTPCHEHDFESTSRFLPNKNIWNKSNDEWR